MNELPSSSNQDISASRTPVSLKELRQFFSWLKERMSSTSLNQAEKKQLSDWLTQRAKGHPHIDGRELELLKRDLLK